MERLPTTPVAFEPNLGQFDRAVKFASRANGYNLFLTTNEAVVVMEGTVRRPSPSRAADLRLTTSTRPGIVRLRFVGASPQPALESGGMLPGKTNYFIGDQKNWRSNVPHFGQLTYREIYPGTDLVFYGNPQKLEMDFRLAAGAVPENILLGFQAGRTPEVNATGDLVVEDSGHQLILQRPRAYQVLDGIEHDREVSYRLTPTGQVGFRLGAYDRTLPMVIDPVVVFSTFLGGSGSDAISAVAVDQFGSPYVLGTTTSPDFPTTNVLRSTGAFFLTKLNAVGSAIVYSTLFGGAGTSADLFSCWTVGNLCRYQPIGMAVDSLGNPYVAGVTTDSTYPTTTNAYQKTFMGGLTDAFVTKFNASGSAITYSTFVGGSGEELLGGMALDPSGEVLLAGSTTSNDFPTMTPFQGSLRGVRDAFVAKLSADGSALVFSTYLGGSTPVATGANTTTDGNAIATDAAGDAFVTGSTSASDFPLQHPYSSTPDSAFITKFSTTGALSYSTYFPAGVSSAIAVDSTGSFYVAGKGPDLAFPMVNPVVTCTVGLDCPGNWLTKFDSAGSTVMFSTPFAGCGVASMALDSTNDVYAVGACLMDPDIGVSVPVVNGIYKSGYFNLTGIAPAVPSLLFTTNIPGGTRACLGCNALASGPISVALDSGGNIFVAGLTADSFPLVAPLQPNFGGFQSSSQNPVSDAFLMKIENTNAPAAGIPGTVSFGITPVGTSSTVFANGLPSQVSLANLGSSNLVITSLQPSGDFTETDTCVGTVSAASTCNINITFTPTLAGTRNGTITITDNAAGSPQSFALTGVGGIPQVSLMPLSLTFPTQSPGTTSASQPVQINNPGQANLVISRIDVSAGFQETNTCSASVAPGSSCTVSVAFAPSASASGPVTGTLTITDNASGSPQTVSLTGTAGTPTLGLAVSGPSSQTVQAGNTATYTVSIGGNGVGGTANLSCAGAPTGSQCSVPSSVTVSANSATQVKITASTTSRGFVLPWPASRFPALWLLVLALAGAACQLNARSRLQIAPRLAFALSVLFILSSCGCGGGGSSNSFGTPAGTYTLTVTAATPSASESLPLTLIVQ